MQNNYKYRVFGLSILSSFELPDLFQVDFEKPDVIIAFGKTPESINNITRKGIIFEARRNCFLFKFDSVGSYLVENGTHITISVKKNSNLDDLRLFLMGSVFGALLHQRELLAFHSSCIAIDGKATIIGGISGSGKSSLAFHLAQKGFNLLADDISAISAINGIPIVYPGITSSKLWKDVVETSGYDIQNLNKIRSQVNKYRIPAKDIDTTKSFMVDKIVILNTHNVKDFEVQEIKGAQKIGLLRSHTYRFQYIEGLETLESHFKLSCIIAAKCPVYVLKRPIAPLNLDKTTEVLLQID